jgi:hypothetical protein
MRGITARIRRVKAFVGGFLIGLSLWTPVFVATAAEDTEWQLYGLPGGLAMFCAGIWLRLGGPSPRGPKTQSRDPAGPSHPGMDRLVT